MSYYFHCPSCKKDDQFFIPTEQPDNTTGCLLLIFGGLLPYLLFMGSKGKRIQCGHCGYLFRQPALPNSPVAKLARGLILLSILFLFISFFLLVEPELAAVLPHFEWLTGLTVLIRDNAYTATFMFIAFSIVFCSVVILASIISNGALHKEFRADFKTRPDLYRKGEDKERTDET